ncbi:hypothetical protein N7532_009054 [Penicillium argentinense]|uniref:D-isomer specific 2-hydroxyacid dehydrogenase NAD-binding domain-containing protein n=1 Tax=Penicillium argentinense TaxID=1131581 RepID=A0A9W9EYV3_9EURO|nr:uncharacterized protein N7532_009054 [Penicillium argentinense]KAJ5090370.1 hypothetical protein N7532_009054 [Penicillium argentinense]
MGRAIERRCRPFGLKTIHKNRNPLSAVEAEAPEYVPFDELLSKSDFISASEPLNAKTKHLVGTVEIAKMKPSVVIINTARGAVKDEAAKTDALEEGHITTVGLDVFEGEPKINVKLLKQELAFMVSHIGTHTVETLAKM